MAGTLQLKLTAPAGLFSTAATRVEQRIERAATVTLRQAADLAKAAARASVQVGGGSAKWRSAIQARVFPTSGTSLHPAAVIFSKIKYAGAFEFGAAVQGRPLLWLPLDNTPVGAGLKRMSPAEFVQRIGVLYSMKIHGKPFLGAVVRSTATRAAKGISLSQLKRGRNPHGRGTVRLVPIYVGIANVVDPKLTDIVGAVVRVGRSIPELYKRNLEAVLANG